VNWGLDFSLSTRYFGRLDSSKFWTGLGTLSPLTLIPLSYMYLSFSS